MPIVAAHQDGGEHAWVRMQGGWCVDGSTEAKVDCMIIEREGVPCSECPHFYSDEQFKKDELGE